MHWCSSDDHMWQLCCKVQVKENGVTAAAEIYDDSSVLKYTFIESSPMQR